MLEFLRCHKCGIYFDCPRFEREFEAVLVREEVTRMSRKYEVVFVLNPKLGEEGIVSTYNKIKNLIETSATLDGVDEWGRKRLAYEIDDQREGIYYLVRFTAEAEFPAELERVLKLTEGVMRFLVTRQDD